MPWPVSAIFCSVAGSGLTSTRSEGPFGTGTSTVVASVPRVTVETVMPAARAVAAASTAAGPAVWAPSERSRIVVGGPSAGVGAAPCFAFGRAIATERRIAAPIAVPPSARRFASTACAASRLVVGPSTALAESEKLTIPTR